MSKKKETAVVAKKDLYSLAKPSEMVQLAAILREHIKKNDLSVVIQGKNYTYVEGWQYAGGLMGLFPKIVSVKKQEGTDIAWVAEAQIINAKNNEVMSTGFAICSKKESKKSSFDEYAILSMAQTRAIGKAYRNLIGWVMKMTGYESTPAEEMKPDEKEVGKMFETAEKMIRACKSTDTLIEIEQKIQGSKKYNADQKAKLKAIISSRVDELDA